MSHDPEGPHIAQIKVERLYMKNKHLESVETDASFSQGHHHAKGKLRNEKSLQQTHEKLGRFTGVNRYGEYHPHASHYDDEDHRTPWSQDLRSEGHFKNHSGKGPRGYVRRDERILEDICEALIEQPDIDATKLKVSVQTGVVTIVGSVNEEYELNAIEYIVKNTSGVKKLVDRIEIHDKYERPRFCK